MRDLLRRMPMDRMNEKSSLSFSNNDRQMLW